MIRIRKPASKPYALNLALKTVNLLRPFIFIMWKERERERELGFISYPENLRQSRPTECSSIMCKFRVDWELLVLYFNALAISFHFPLQTNIYNILCVCKFGLIIPKIYWTKEYSPPAYCFRLRYSSYCCYNSILIPKFKLVDELVHSKPAGIKISIWVTNDNMGIEVTSFIGFRQP